MRIFNVRIRDRIVGDSFVSLGVEGDERSAGVRFMGVPEELSEPVVSLKWRAERLEGEAYAPADEVILAPEGGGYLFEVTGAISQYGGRTITAMLSATGEDGVKWNTREFRMKVCPVGDYDGTVTPPSLTLIEQVLVIVQDMQADIAAMDFWLEGSHLIARMPWKQPPGDIVDMGDLTGELDAIVAFEAEARGAESARIAAEGERVAAESGRIAAESARAAAEPVRLAAESERQAMEVTRQSQEAARQSGSAQAIAAANAAAEAASEVAGDVPGAALKVAAPAFTNARYLAPAQPATLHTVTPGSSIHVTADAALTLTHNGAQLPMAAGQTITLTATGGDTLSASAGQPLVKYSQQSDSVRHTAQPKATATGAIAQVTGVWPDTGMEVIARNYLTQAGTPTPDAPVAISGAAEQMEMRIRGKNLCPRGTNATIEGITTSWQSDGSVILNGTATGSGAAFNVLGAYLSVPEIIPHSSGRTFSISGGHDGVIVRAQSYDQASGVRLSYDSAGGVSSTFTLPEGRVLTRLVLQINAPATLTNVRIYPQLELGSAATPYAPYIGYSVSTPLPAPIYGLPGAMDEVDLANGKIVRRTTSKILTGDETVSSSTIAASSGYVYAVGAPDSMTNGVGQFGSAIISSHFTQPNGNGTADRSIGNSFLYSNSSGTRNIYFVAAQATVADFKAWLAAQYAAGTPVTVYYQLAQPVIAQIPPIALPAPSDITTAYANTRETELRALMSGDGVRALIDDLQAQITALTGA